MNNNLKIKIKNRTTPKINILDKKLYDIKVDDIKFDDINIKLEDIKLEDNKLDDNKLDDIKLDDIKLEDIKLEEKNKFDGGLKLNLTKKPQNSPLLSIHEYIYKSLQQGMSFSNMRSMWEKYEKNNVNALLIKSHNLNFEIFREIAERILETYEPYQISITPHRNFIHIENSELKDLVI